VARLAYRPAATAEAFVAEPLRAYDLEAIAADIGATYHRSRLERVSGEQQSVRLASGARLGYDVLILALGARARAAVPGAVMFRDQRDVPRFRRVLSDVLARRITRLVFAVPSQGAWPLPAYELSLLTRRRVEQQGLELEISLVTPEGEPLEALGHMASRLVAELLDDRSVRFIGDSVPDSVRRDGSLAIAFDGALEADRVVAIPELHGVRISGVPGSWQGFVPVDAVGRVDGLSGVYAAGDMTTFPIKQGGLAAQQADRIAHTVAAELGAPVKELHERWVLRTRLLDGDGALVLRTELDEFGHPSAATIEHHDSRTDPHPKVFARYLSAYLAGVGAHTAVVA
jgi:sulfide:quinone oxidoreductase